MRILIVHNQLWAHYKSKLFAELHRQLAQKYPGSVYLVIQIALYESSRIGMKGNDMAAYDYPHRVLFPKSLDEVSLRERIPALFKAFHDFRPTVLNVTGYFDWAQVLLMCYARWRGVKIVMSSESSPQDHERSPFREYIKRWIVQRAHAYFCFGSTSVNYLKSLGVPDHRIAVRNAAVIDEELIATTFSEARAALPPSRRRNFIYAGRLAEEKNIRILLEAYASLLSENGHTDWGLLIVGDGPIKKELESFAGDFPAGKITFAGGVAWHEVPWWLAKADVLVLPSLSEPWGLVVNEALVCGLPVIVSEKCGCAEDLVDPGENGFIFNPADKGALIRHMRFFMTLSGAGMAGFSEKSRKKVAPFAVGKVAAEMVATYARLSENHTGK